MLSRPYTNEPTPHLASPSSPIVGCLFIKHTRASSDSYQETFSLVTSSFPPQNDFIHQANHIEGFEIYNVTQKTHHVFERKKTGKPHLWTYEEEHLLQALNPSYDPLSLAPLFFVERKKVDVSELKWTFEELVGVGEKHKVHFSAPVLTLFDMLVRDGAYSPFNESTRIVMVKVVTVLERIQSIYGLQELGNLMARVFPPTADSKELSCQSY